MKTRLLREKLKIWFWTLLTLLFCGFFVLFCFVVVVIVFFWLGRVK